MTKQIILTKFPTHSPTSKSGNKWIKINGNLMYSGLQHYTRSFVVNFIKNYIKGEIPEDFKLKKEIFPITIKIILCVPKNFGNISIRKGAINWKPPSKTFVPNWDLDNQWIWTKVIVDTFKEYFPTGDDNVSVVNSVQVFYREVPTFVDRKIVIIFESTKTTFLNSINYDSVE